MIKRFGRYSQVVNLALVIGSIAVVVFSAPRVWAAVSPQVTITKPARALTQDISPFLYPPFLGIAAEFSIFDHSNPNYIPDGRITAYNGAWAVPIPGDLYPCNPASAL